MIRKSIPNVFTMGNLYCGFLSIVFAMQGDYKNAGILVLIGMMLDSMDGRAARILKVQSEIGKELDSLADIVTFGVAPAVLAYFNSFKEHGMVGLLIAGLFPLFGAFRLARFNITSKNTDKYFTGVPITAAGGLLTILVMLNHWVSDIVIDASFMTLCFLMVSRVKIPSFKNVPLPKYGTIITVLMLCIIYLIIFKSKHHEKIPYFIFIAIPLYILFICYRFALNKKKKNKGNRSK